MTILKQLAGASGNLKLIVNPSIRPFEVGQSNPSQRSNRSPLLRFHILSPDN